MMREAVPKQWHVITPLLIALCWGLSGPIGWAQQAGSMEPKPTAGPTPIPLSEIASQAESTLRSVQNLNSSLTADQITAIVEKRLSPLTREIELRGTE
ncbi:MAG: hypothetical protein WAM44_14620, partial [Chthoniobacterales bacterium]